MKAWRIPLLWRVLAWIGVASLLIPLAGYFALRALLAPLPGEWTTQVNVGPLRFQAGVPSLIRLATSHWIAPRLDGLRWASSAGLMRLRWLPDAQALAVRCAPCVLRLRGLAGENGEPMQLQDVTFTVQRDFNELQGLVEAGAVRGSWYGVLEPGRLRVALDIPSTTIADGYALFAARIPELAQAHIEGRFSLKAEVTLPNGELQLNPQVEGFAVSGLGTGALAGAQSGCSAAPPDKPAAPAVLDIGGWLARAVIAAEDQRFWDHAGYDLTEFSASFTLNQRKARIARGGSTLSQQLAKLLVTGGERTPERKLRELLYAADMEQSLGKARILRLYLENAPWGTGVCGAHAAAQVYFGRTVGQLTPAQAVWLASMLHNPGMEASRWAGRGQIDVVRAQWVANGVRGLKREQRASLVADLPQLAAAPPVSPLSLPPPPSSRPPLSLRP